MTEFPENIASNLDQCLVAIGLDVSQNSLGCVDLQLLVICHNLDDSLPNLITDVVASHCNQAECDVDIPLHICGILLSQDSNFQDHFLSYRIVGRLEIAQKFAHNRLRVCLIAHAVKQIQTLSSHTNISVPK